MQDPELKSAFYLVIPAGGAERFKAADLGLDIVGLQVRGRGGSVQRLALTSVDDHEGLYCCAVPDDLVFDEDHEDDDARPAVRIIEERPPLREGGSTSTTASGPRSARTWKLPTWR